MRFIFVLVLLFAAVVGCGAQARTQRAPAAARRAEEQFQQDQKAIAALQQQDIAASIAFDTEKLLLLCTNDVVLLPPDRAPIVGKDALRAYYLEAKKQLGNTDILGYDENWEEVQVSGDLAVEWGTISERTRAANAEKETSTTVRALRVLKRQQDGSWLVSRTMWNNVAPAAPATPPSPK